LLAAGAAAAQQPTQLPTLTVETPRATGGTAARAPASGPVLAPAPQAASAAVPTTPAASNGDAVTAAGQPIDSIGTQVTVIPGDDLRRQQTRLAVDALRNTPGVVVSSSGSVGGLTQVRIRGAEGRHTRVVVDGIEVNSTKDNEFDFSNLLAEDIERIEVIRGPMSALYGAGALGGTINIVTRAYRGPPQATLRIEGGSFGTKDIAGRVAAGSDTGYVALSGQVRSTGGIDVSPFGAENDGTRLASFGLRAGMKLSPTARLDVTLRHTDKRAEYDDFGRVARIPFLTADDANNVLKDRTTIAGVALGWDGLGGALTQEIKSNYAAFSSRNRFESLLPGQFGEPVGTLNNTSDKGDRWVGSYGLTYRMAAPSIGLKHAITGLIDAKRETYTPFSDFGFGDGDGLQRDRTQQAAGAEWTGTFLDRLNLSAGARQEWNSDDKDIATWRASLSYAWREAGLRPHASVGKSAKLPGMFDLFGPNSTTYQSNPNLKAETSTGFDVGIEWTTWGGRALFDVTYFAHDLRDKITGFGGFDPVTLRSFTTNAAGVSKREGVEVSGRFALTTAISLGLAYTYTDADQPSGAPELRRPAHSGRGDLRYTSTDGKTTASLVAAYNGSLLDVRFGPFFAGRPNAPLDPYWLVSVAASHKLQPNLEIFGRIENALNAKYQEIYGYEAPGLAAYVGLKVTLGGVP
jgi:vitamin B12 transporter